MASVLNLGLGIGTLAVGIISFIVSLVFILVMGIELLFSSNLLNQGAKRISEGLMLTGCRAIVSNGNQFLLNSFNQIHSFICKPVQMVHWLRGTSDPGPGVPPTSRIPANCDASYPNTVEYATFAPATLPSSLAWVPTASFPSGPKTLDVTHINLPSQV